MKILVTGASGFIGKQVLRQLLANNHQVIASCLPGDDFSYIGINSKVTVIPYDFNQIKNKDENLFEFFEQPDAMIHLAWQGLPNYNNPFHLNEVLFTQIKIIENLIKTGLKNIVITGTCQEYGMVNGCLNEDIIPNPHTYYALAKDTLRRNMELMQKDFDFRLKWARLFYMYGEGQNPNSLIPQLLAAIKNKQTEFNMSGGEQLRDYLPVEKVADYLVKICLQDKVSGIINCCSGQPVSVRKLVENMVKENNATIKLNLGFYPYPNYEPFAFWGDNKKLQKILNND